MYGIGIGMFGIGIGMFGIGIGMFGIGIDVWNRNRYTYLLLRISSRNSPFQLHKQEDTTPK